MSFCATRSIYFPAYSTFLYTGSQLRWTSCSISSIRTLATLVDTTKTETTQNASVPQALNNDTRSIIKALPLYSPTVEAFLRSFQNNRPVGILPLPRTIFAHPLRADILHRVVTWQRNNMRQGTGSSKGRSDVRGSTRKIQPQKGTGKARHGSIRAPQFRGGGKAFGPKPRDFSSDLPAQVVAMGMRVALSTKYAQNQLVVVRDMLLKSHKTKDMAILIKRNCWKNALFVTAADGNKNLERAVKNILGVDIMVWDEVTCYDMLRFENLVIEKDALKLLADSLKVEQSSDDEFLMTKALDISNVTKE